MLRQTPRNIFVFSLPLLITNVSASVNLPTSFITQLSDIDIHRDYGSDNGEYIGSVNLLAKNPCTNESNQFAYFYQQPNQLDKQGLTDQLVTLYKNNKNIYYHVTLDSCDLTKLKFSNIQTCNSEICPEKYVLDNKIWLTGDYKETPHFEIAGYFVQLPLKKDQQKNLWLVQGRFAEDIFNEPISDSEPALAFESYTDDSEFKDSKFVGEFTRYYYNGNIANKANYNTDGLLDGHALTYFASGKLHQDALSINGKLEGLIITFHENGTEESRVTYHDGKALDGLCLHYFDNGKISRKHSYLNGEYDGELIEYDQAGRITQQSQYNQGKDLESNYYIYTDEGILKQHEVYINNVQRVYQTWQNDGTPRVDWKWNEQHQEIGEQKTWHSNGNLEEVKLYNNGVLIKKTTWGEDGQKWYEDDFYPNKQQKESKRWDNEGNLTNHYFYDENGKKISAQESSE